MNGLLMMIIAIVVLGGAYLIYGRYLAKTWGIDPKAKTPAYELEDGVDYVPADTNVVFGHQFASIAGAGPINGPIQAAIFGWVPVLLWVLIGGVFFGAVQDFVSMYASVKNKGRTIGYIIEEYSWLCFHLAAVWFRQPAAVRTGTGGLRCVPQAHQAQGLYAVDSHGRDDRCNLQRTGNDHLAAHFRPDRWHLCLGFRHDHYGKWCKRADRMGCLPPAGICCADSGSGCRSCHSGCKEALR